MEPGPVHRRRRPAVACSECRRRKIRCDRGFPCGPCRKSLPVLACIYHSQPTQRTASALPHSRRTQQQQQQQHHHPPRPKQSTRNVALAKINSLAFDPDAFAGIGQIGLDWPSSWQQQHGVPPSPSVLLAEAEAAAAAADYFQSPDFSLLDDSSHKGADASLVEHTYAGSPETTGHSSVCPSMDGGPGYGDDRWCATLAQVGKMTFLVQGMTRRRDFLENQPAPPENRQADGGGGDDLWVPPLADVVLQLESQARLQKEQNDAQSFARLSPLLKSSSNMQQLLPPRPVCKKLVSAYFETFGSVLCILDTTAFFNDLDRFWQAGEGSRPSTRDHDGVLGEAFSHKLLVVVALGSVTARPCGTGGEAERTRQTNRRNHAIVCVQHTRQWLAQKTARGIRADLDIAQILCLLALARLTQLHTDPWPRRSSTDGTVILTGDHDLARLGMQMGLHREPPRLSVVAPAKKAEAEMRRRLWATMLELSLHQYLDAELPPLVSAESYDCAAPSPVELEEDARSYLAPHDQRVPAATILAVLSRTQRLRLQILQHLHSPGASSSYKENNRFAADLIKVCNAETNHLLFSGMAKPSSFQLWLLNILTRPFLLALNAHFAGEMETDFASFHFRRMRMETAIVILRPSPHDDEPSLAPSQTRIHAGWAGSRSKTATSTYPFLPTPGTVEPMTNNEQRNGLHDAASTALCVGGPSYFAVVHRQVLATLCADVITEIQEGLFPTLDAAMLHSAVAIVGDAANKYRDQVCTSGGVDACRESIMFAAAHGLALALLHRCSALEVDKSIMSSVWTALHHCCRAMGEPAQGILEMEWDMGEMETTNKSMPMGGNVDVGATGQANTQSHFVLEQQDDAPRLDLSAVDTEIAEIWAIDDDESYFSIDITL
ncbi:C6 zinc finger domain-containing [Cordyceps militaris]|uniref:C6 zinc finger domain-containing n=1 Tax=Cordyceps militaris TaxID=73501 RepID=A0A2H4SRW7_CORMI|nr:C6 zinc finger domain-containing [Cordyceps militaris]